MKQVEKTYSNSNHDAVEEAYCKYHTALMAFVSARFSPELAEEAVSELFLRLLELPEEYSARLESFHYLKKAAYNKAMDILRRRNRLEEILVGYSSSESVGDFSELFGFYDDRFENALDDREKKLFQLSIEGYNDEEIAKKLDITVSNVRVLRLRARKKLTNSIG